MCLTGGSMLTKPLAAAASTAEFMRTRTSAAPSSKSALMLWSWSREEMLTVAWNLLSVPSGPWTPARPGAISTSTESRSRLGQRTWRRLAGRLPTLWKLTVQPLPAGDLMLRCFSSWAGLTGLENSKASRQDPSGSSAAWETPRTSRRRVVKAMRSPGGSSPLRPRSRGSRCTP